MRRPAASPHSEAAEGGRSEGGLAPNLPTNIVGFRGV